MGEHVANLARLRIASETGVLPRDVGMWAFDLLAELEPAAERIEHRNALLREAAAAAGGSRWAQARRLEKEIRAARARPGLLRERALDDGVRELVSRALEIDPDLPRSIRHLLRIVGS